MREEGLSAEATSYSPGLPNSLEPTTPDCPSLQCEPARRRTGDNHDALPASPCHSNGSSNCFAISDRPVEEISWFHQSRQKLASSTTAADDENDSISLGSMYRDFYKDLPPQIHCDASGSCNSPARMKVISTPLGKGKMLQDSCSSTVLTAFSSSVSTTFVSGPPMMPLAAVNTSDAASEPLSFRLEEPPKLVSTQVGHSDRIQGTLLGSLQISSFFLRFSSLELSFLLFH
jgi:hypothetical protein